MRSPLPRRALPPDSESSADSGKNVLTVPQTSATYRGGSVAERSKAPVLKTGVGQPTRGSNPFASARKNPALKAGFFLAEDTRLGVKSFEAEATLVVSAEAFRDGPARERGERRRCSESR